MGISGVRVALVVVDGFVAVTAVGGGIALLSGLEANRFPADWLQRTPFSTYAIPGLILAGVVGGSAAIAAAAALLSPRAGRLASLLAGVVLMGWIVGEVLLLKQPAAPTWAEIFYFTVGLVMAVLGLIVR
jgi:hypothetical protein